MLKKKNIEQNEKKNQEKLFKKNSFISNIDNLTQTMEEKMLKSISEIYFSKRSESFSLIEIAKDLNMEKEIFPPK